MDKTKFTLGKFSFPVFLQSTVHILSFEYNYYIILNKLLFYEFAAATD
jgi:hypothetical protein